MTIRKTIYEKTMRKSIETSKPFPSTNGSLTRAGARFHKKLKFLKHGFPSKIESKLRSADPPNLKGSALPADPKNTTTLNCYDLNYV